jgi:hypothetical protein
MARLSEVDEVTKNVRLLAIICDRSALRMGIDIQPPAPEGGPLGFGVIAKAMT